MALKSCLPTGSRESAIYSMEGGAPPNRLARQVEKEEGSNEMNAILALSQDTLELIPRTP